MTTPKPFTVDAVGIRPCNGGEVVGVRVAERLAGALVVDPGHGEPLARLMLAAPVVDAARKAVGVHRGKGDLSLVLDALDELAAALQANDDVDPLLLQRPDADVFDVPGAEPGPRGIANHVRPWRLVESALNTLYKPDGGLTVFRGVSVVGVVLVPTPDGPRPRCYGTHALANNALECGPEMAGTLRDIAQAIERQCTAAKAEREAKASGGATS